MIVSETILAGFGDVAATWLLTYLLHSTLLIAVAWVASRAIAATALAGRETLWRIALVGGLITASLQMGLGLSPVLGSIRLSVGSGAVEAAAIDSAPAPREVSDLAAPVAATVRSVGLAAAKEGRREARAGTAWLVGLTTFWVAGALLLAARLGLGFWLLRGRLSDRIAIREGAIYRLLRRLLGASRLDRPVLLTASRRLGVPIARGLRRPEICLPSRVVHELDADHQETIVAHELAHLERRDPAWLLFYRSFGALLFVQPLNLWVIRRLQEIAEYRCDDRAVEVTGRPVTLAKCLTRVADWRVSRSTLAAAPAMAVRGSRLGRRVRRLLDRGYPMPDEGVPRWVKLATVVALVLVVAAAPGFSGAGEPEGEEQAAEATPESAPEAPAAPEAPEPGPRPAATPGAVPAPPAAPLAPTPPPLSVVAPAAVPAPPVAPEAPEPAPRSAAAPVAVPAPPAAPKAPEVPPPPTPAPSAAPAPLAAPAPARPSIPVAAPSPASVAAPSPALPPLRQVATLAALSPQDTLAANDEALAQAESEREELEEALESIDEAIEEEIDRLEEAIEDELDDIYDREMDSLENELEEVLETEVEASEEQLEAEIEALEVQLERIEDRVDDIDSESTEERFERDLEPVEDRLDEISERFEDRLENIEERFELQLETAWVGDIESRIEEQLERTLNATLAEEERLQRLGERLAEESRRLAALDPLTEEEIQRFRAEARRLAEESRPSAEELERMRAEARELAASLRPDAEEIRRFVEDLRGELGEWQREYRQELESESRNIEDLARQY